MKKEVRYAHSEGITDLTLTPDGKKLLTCGTDGEIRVWDGFMDEDPVVFSADDCCFGLVCHEDKVIVGTESHTVEMYQLPKGKRIGVKAKFTSSVNHISISKDGSLLVAGSGDTTVQVVKLNDTSLPPKKIEAHTGPVFSVSLDPLQKYFASAGGDGSVCVWSLTDSTVSNLAKKWEHVIPTCADITLTSTLCRMDWTPADGKYLAFPDKDNKVVTYSRDSWERSRVFQNKEIKKILSVIKFSSCGNYLAAGGSDGAIIVWNASNAQSLFRFSSEHAITSLVFNQLDSTELYYADIRGRLFWLSSFLSQKTETPTIDSGIGISEGITENGTADDDNDPFEDGMDELFDQDDDNEFSISKIKAAVGFDDDGEYVGVAKATQGIRNKDGFDDDDDVRSITSGDGESVHSSRAPVIIQAPNPFTEPQKPFQPSSSPVNLEHRFMVWNNVGIIRSYSTEDDDAIDVEFHDVSFRQAIHLRNQFDFTMGSMSSDAVILACDKSKEHPSKIFCLNFGAWDTNKEWTIDMPKDEVILSIGIGSGWIVAATNLNRIRLFTIGGVQNFIYELPGEVVSVSGFENLLFIAYHQGVGINGSQSISYSIHCVTDCKLRTLVPNTPLPLSPKASLSWIGFSDEGTPVFSDTKETLRLLNGQMWTPFCGMKEMLSGPNDHFWVVGVSETAQNVRAIKCKGAKYPPALPRPILMMIDAKIPLAEMDTEKSQLEDELLRSLLLTHLSKKMDKKGFDFDEYKEKATKDIRQKLMDLCVLSCKGNREFRAAEYISLMETSESVQVAVKYAGRLRRKALTDRLVAIGLKKMEEPEESEEEEDFETKAKIYISNSTSFNRTGRSSAMDVESQDLFVDEDSNSNDASSRRKSVTAENPLLKKQKQEIRDIICPMPVRRNPFKKGVVEEKQEDSQSQSQSEENSEFSGKGLAVIDAWKKPPEKPVVPEFNLKHPQSKKATTKKKADKELTAEPKKKARLTDWMSTAGKAKET